ncbi:glucoamylase [Umbelopsis sp. PMI_123]|nr:glucoamylase [Umbelopsis sp. PMI_123]
MRAVAFLSAFVLLGQFVQGSTVTSSSASSYLTKEDPIAFQRILDNIGPNLGAKDGIVVASPNTENPDYLYTWTRDAALTMKSLIERLVANKETSLIPTIEAYIKVQLTLQHIDNLSGNFSDLSGLGEPKFEINATEFTGDWGRPQRDGPALRATALVAYGKYAQKHGNSKFVNDSLWPVLKNDLDYVTKYWNLTGFDLWEETNGSSFFTISASHRALFEGAAFASSIGHSNSSYLTQATNILCFLQSFWDSDSNVINADVANGKLLRNLDSGTTAGIIHGFDADAGCDAITFQPCSDRALAHHYALVNAFRGYYPINNGKTSSEAVALGRYLNDVYMNGNPWYLTTLAAAEQLYDAIYVWKKQGQLEITTVSKDFFNQFGSFTTGKYKSSSSTFKKIVSAVSAYADGFVDMVAKYTPSNGRLSEQFSGWNGTATSAKDLTWSYASAITTKAAKDGKVPDSWGASKVTSPKGSCKPGPVHVVPNDIISVKFVATDTELTSFGSSSIYVVGSIPELGSWSTSAAVRLLGEPDTYGVYSTTIKLPPNTSFEYKYIEKLDCEQAPVTWENYPGGGNREGTTPASGSLTYPTATFEH